MLFEIYLKTRDKNMNNYRGLFIRRLFLFLRLEFERTVKDIIHFQTRLLCGHRFSNFRQAHYLREI